MSECLSERPQNKHHMEVRCGYPPAGERGRNEGMADGNKDRVAQGKANVVAVTYKGGRQGAFFFFISPTSNAIF